jgi:serine/threonine protein kinase
LGQGAYGIVRMGTVRINNEILPIAIKVMKNVVEIEDFKSFLFELKVMAYIGHHPHIVSLVAACTQNIDQRMN